MSVAMIITIALIILLGLMVIEAPVSVALAGSGVVGILLLRNFDTATSALGTIPYEATSNYTLSVIPLYVLLGMFALRGKLAERLYGLASNLLRWLPGGLGVATVGACAGFSAVSGSSLATAATVGRLSTLEMRKYGYPPALAGGIVAAAGTLGILIPPSILMVMYAIMAKAPIGKMLIAGVVPGMIMALIFAIYTIIKGFGLPRAAVRNEKNLDAYLTNLKEATANTAHAQREDGGSETVQTNVLVKERVSAETVPPKSINTADSSHVDSGNSVFAQVRALGWLGLIVVVILSGLFTGAFTIIESAAIGAALALVILVVELHKTGISQLIKSTLSAVRDTVGIIGMTFGIIVGAYIFTRFLVMAQVPNKLSQWVTSFDISPELVVVLILILLIPLGMFLESLSIILVVVPLVVPVILELGFDPIWFGVLFVIMLEIGLITPPLGINVFVTSTASDIPLETVFKGILPFVLLMLLCVAILFVFPDVITWLPSLLLD